MTRTLSTTLGTRSILTGIKPTGVPHIGNYLGAIAPALRRASGFQDAYFFIADYHALNSVQDPVRLKELTYHVAATWLAAGLDPTKVHFYRQSDVPEIFELETILNTITPKSWMNKMHAYKAQIDRNNKSGESMDSGINIGLYTYPLLMASDILTFGAEIIPVGHDQVQHVEIARDIAHRFNKQYRTDILTLPTYVLEEGIEELPGLDGRKMSKSYNNTIPLFAGRNEWTNAVKKIITDSVTHTPDSLKETTYYKIFKAVATPEQTAETAKVIIDGEICWARAKERLVDCLEQRFGAASVVYNDLLLHPEKIDEILSDGAKTVRKEAQNRLQVIKRSIGI